MEKKYHEYYKYQYLEIGNELFDKIIEHKLIIYLKNSI
jgi:hypothetical protein